MADNLSNPGLRQRPSASKSKNSDSHIKNSEEKLSESMNSISDDNYADDEDDEEVTAEVSQIASETDKKTGKEKLKVLISEDVAVKPVKKSFTWKNFFARLITGMVRAQ